MGQRLLDKLKKRKEPDSGQDQGEKERGSTLSSAGKG